MGREGNRRSVLGVITFTLVMTYAGKSIGQTSSRSEPVITTTQSLAVALGNSCGNIDCATSLLETHSHLLSPTLWQALMDAAARSYHNNQPDRSFETYLIAQQVALRLNDQVLVGKSLYSLGRAYSANNQFDKAKEAYLDSWKAFSAVGSQRDLVYVLSDLGTLSLITEDYAGARSFSEASIETAKSAESNALNSGVACAFSTLGELSAREGNLWDAFEYFQRALDVFVKLDQRNPTYRYYVADVSASLGRLYTSTGDHVRGLAFLNRALAISNSLNRPDQVAAVLNSTGYLYLEQEDYAQARSNFQESLQLYRNSNNQREEARLLLNLGVIEQRQLNYDAAVSLFKSSLELARRTNNFEVLIAAGEGIGVALAGKRDFEAALEILEQNLRLAVDKQERIREAELHWRIAQVQLDLRYHNLALDHAQAALQIARLMHSPKLTHVTLALIGEIYEAQNRIELAVAAFKEAVAAAELMRERVGGDEIERQLFFQDKVQSYTRLVDLLLTQNHVNEGLFFAERAKARVLFDVFKAVASETILTPAEKDIARQLNRRIFEVKERIRVQSTENPTLQNALYEQLGDALSKRTLYQKDLDHMHPELRGRAGKTPEMSDADLDRLTLKGDAAYLEYVIGPDRVDLFVLRSRTNSKTQLQALRLAIKPDELAQIVARLHDRLAMRHPDYESLAREVYKLLIEPARNRLDGISEICIVPDGFLWNLPFQALITSNGQYLLEEYSLYYAPSLSVLAEMRSKPEVRNDRSLVAFANPFNRVRNARLPETEAEVSSISKLFDSTKSRVLIGKAASEESFNRLATSYSTFHFATHGVLDNKQPLSSYLMLTETGANAGRDGKLEAREIINLKIGADLAVLSACETANGQITPGEGVIGMSWAFFIAGTRSMVASQWPVHSGSTTQLMKSFYVGLNKGPRLSGLTRARALRRASLEVMRQRDYRHPFYWAPFMLIGAGS